jgi:O-antigen ligase
MFGNFNFDKTFHYLLIALAFLIPLTVFGANLVIVILCIIWVISGSYRSKFTQIINNKFLLASIIFFLVHVIGLIWTSDLNWGLHIAHKMWYFIGLLPILYTIVQKKYIRTYVYAFLLAIALTEIISYMIWFELIEPFKNAIVENPTPFMSHISYNPILAFAIYLVLYEIFLNKKLNNMVFLSYSFFAVSMTINMFITGGRAGQVVFFVLIAILIFQLLEKERIKSIFIVCLLIPGIFFTAYQSSNNFKDRVDTTINNTMQYSDNKYTSVGYRLTYAINSWEIIKNNIFIGVGTGDYPSEYKKINQIRSPKIANTTNPHNMYVLVLSQFGLLGLVSMLSIFYYQIKIAYRSKSIFFHHVGITLPIMYLVIMLSDSYLLGHYTSLMYVFFSSFLYKDFAKN